MAITEADRLEMHLAFHKTMGDKVADTVMEHLPPTGWADVARTSDVDHLATLMDLHFAAVDVKLAAMDKRLDGITNGLWAMGTLSSACFLGIFALIATKL
jgi:hypothetical protein